MGREMVGAREETVAGAVAAAAALLRDSAHVADAQAEARELLLSLIDAPASWLVLHRDDALASNTRETLLAAAQRRARGAPTQYATGRAHFRHLTLAVDERVLIPRPETELLVELALDSAGEGGVAIDVGTGSGCIALALASEGRFDRVVGTDVSSDAIAVARANAAALAPVLRAPVELRVGSLLGPARGIRARVVVSNPPYIAAGEASALPAAVRDWEPALALYSGSDGMGHIAALVREAADALEPGGQLLMEVDARRASLAAELAAADGRYERVQVRLDLTGRERFVLARRASDTAAMPNDGPSGRTTRGAR
ncbi:MAG TPA: peptide chain release factor N(5)-glutamine methyltransferase [Gemmatimonadaceae bacterium]|nr:peptide chain release factor N(5)-glutamine methyltransferase [Gemmatimonadaceae bacterium]